MGYYEIAPPLLEEPSGSGIRGEIVHTPSHRAGSVSLILDSGDCIAGDLEPFEYIEGYEENDALIQDRDLILSFAPKRIFYSHRPERTLG